MVRPDGITFNLPPGAGEMGLAVFPTVNALLLPVVVGAEEEFP